METVGNLWTRNQKTKKNGESVGAPDPADERDLRQGRGTGGGCLQQACDEEGGELVAHLDA